MLISFVPGLVSDRDVLISESRTAPTVPQKSVSSSPRMTSAPAITWRPSLVWFSGCRDGKFMRPP